MYLFKVTKKYEKSVKKLPDSIKKKLAKQLRLLSENPRHNSLYTKKNYEATKLFNETIYESRIDSSYRILWQYENGEIIILLLAGNHEIVEGKK